MATNVPFKTGDVIQQKYTLQVRIGAGTYGVIFQALYKTEDIYKHVAIKLEKSHPQQYTLQISEIIVMKAMIGSKHFAKFFQCGTHDQYKFVVMELLGPSLLRLVNRKRPYYFTLLQLLKFGTQAVKILQELHKAGFVHRDVKPDNFVIGNSLETAGTIYLIDFGLCKQLNKKDGLIIKPTAPGSFRGTMRYASPNAHKHIELGRQDDLISLLYMMIEFYAGKLPWSSQTTDEVKISLLKEQSTPDILLNKMPTVFHEFYNHIFTLDYEDEPDYDMLVDLFKEAAKDQKLDLDSPFEWEQELKNQRAIVTKQQRIDFPFVNNMSTQQQLEKDESESCL
ncbi:MAG: putative protein serine/threonine kinase [Streblomastix strix]|uniref:non-specific serine/threonine protein kinase n=1 Tax=Streblomastix strix TaxID=222440 RepID=A0A5J4WI37_9EUKA|nr:MAG: putative protein serine/threonine kinase [Streblomastix strix]